ncbi:MAG: hypothetical protein ACJ8DC_17055 [Gemmatimonadales bacterium]
MSNPLSADIEQALARVFPPDEQTVARSMLASYGLADHQREVDRVRQALLRLSRGKVAYLGHYLAVAQHDYRDVLYWADHPEQAPKR